MRGAHAEPEGLELRRAQGADGQGREGQEKQP